nr:ABC transporter ATP-binding protein [Rhodoplanes tepidamans]
MRAHRAAVVAGVGLAVLGGVLSFAPQFWLWWLFGPGAGDHQAAGVAVVIAAVVAGRAATALSGGLAHRVAFRIQARLRVAALAALGRTALGFLVGRHSGSLRKIVLDDIDKLEDGIAHLVPETTAAVCAPLVALASLVVLDWRLALAALLPSLAGLALFAGFMRRGEGAARAYYEIVGRIGAATADAVRAVPTMKVFRQDGAALAEIDRLYDRYVAFAHAWIADLARPMGIANGVMSSSAAATAAAGVVLVGLGAVDWPTALVAVAFALGIDDLFTSATSLSFRVEQIAESHALVRTLLDAPPQAVPAVPRRPAGAALAFEDVSFRYGARSALDRVSFVVPAGSVAAVVGPSGAGKSTIVRLIGRFFDVDEGRIAIGGVDLRDMDADTLAATVSFVLQDVFLFRGTIADNIALGRPGASRAEIETAARRARADDFVRRLPDGYDTVLDDRGAGLSGGERQRLSIARALLRDTPVLVLDEATAYADPENEVLIQAALDEIVRGRTVIVVAHRLRTVCRADRILVLDRGRLVEAGRHDDLMGADGLYARLWRRQTDDAPDAGDAAGIAGEGAA